MNSPIYVSDVIEVNIQDLNRVMDLSYEVLEIAKTHDLSSAIMEDMGQLFLVFTYNSPRILDPEEFDYLETIFQGATTTLRALLESEKITLLTQSTSE